jgi:chemotaxis protein methyltransferase CheR
MSSASSLRESGAAGFQQLARLAYDQFGLDLGEGKESLIASRLGKQMKQQGIESLEEYCSFVQHDNTGQSLIALIDALTTNHTSFFREVKHFDFLKQVAVPAWRGRGGVPIWSAACSSGEEPYSLAMTILEEMGKEAGGTQILATDISTRVLSTAAKGLYRQESFSQPLAPWLAKYLLRGRGSFEGWYQIKPDVRRMIRFDRVNLIQPFPASEPFAAIFCRNVMIYFDRPTQERVVNSLAARIEPGGYLFVGHSESLSGIKHSLDYVCPATYRKPGSTKARPSDAGRTKR